MNKKLIKSIGLISSAICGIGAISTSVSSCGWLKFKLEVSCKSSNSIVAVVNETGSLNTKYTFDCNFERSELNNMKFKIVENYENHFSIDDHGQINWNAINHITRDVVNIAVEAYIPGVAESNIIPFSVTVVPKAPETIDINYAGSYVFNDKVGNLGENENCLAYKIGPDGAGKNIGRWKLEQVEGSLDITNVISIESLTGQRAKISWKNTQVGTYKFRAVTYVNGYYVECKSEVFTLNVDYQNPTDIEINDGQTSLSGVAGIDGISSTPFSAKILPETADQSSKINWSLIEDKYSELPIKNVLNIDENGLVSWTKPQYGKYSFYACANIDGTSIMKYSDLITLDVEKHKSEFNVSFNNGKTIYGDELQDLELSNTMWDINFLDNQGDWNKISPENVQYELIYNSPFFSSISIDESGNIFCHYPCTAYANPFIQVRLTYIDPTSNESYSQDCYIFCEIF